MRLYEDTHTEFKSIYTDDIKKTVVAFANTDGGTIHIGRADDGSVVGVDNPDQTQLSLVDSIANAIRPDVTTFVSHSVQEVEGKPIVTTQVQRGTARPYYLVRQRACVRQESTCGRDRPPSTLRRQPYSR